MNSFWRIFFLEATAIIRSKTLAMLSLASVVWMVVFPWIVKSDGTIEGARELYVRFSLGGVFMLLVISLMASATGSIARERAAKRLQLTMVRPVRYFAIALGKIAAHIASGAVVLAIATAILALKADLSRECSHVHSPILPTPREEAEAMYKVYMEDSQSPPELKNVRKATVIRILTQRARDHYQTIPTNGVACWQFFAADKREGWTQPTTDAKIRFRFTNMHDTRQDIKGTIRWGSLVGEFSSMTRSFVEVPFKEGALENASPDEGEISVRNTGSGPLMLRQRQDVHLLLPADSFGMNLLRAYLELVAILGLVIAFGTFLSAGLGRPVALFVAMVTLTVTEMSPSVIEQYPDQFETNRIDRMGLAIARAAAKITRPVSALSPLETLSRDECVEWDDVLAKLMMCLLVMPCAFAFLAALMMPRKSE